MFIDSTSSTLSFSGYLTSGILSANVPPSPDISYLEFCPANVLPSPDISHLEFCPANVPPSPDISHLEFVLANIPPSPDISHPKFCSPTFHFLRISHIRNPIRQCSTFSGYLTSRILFADVLPSPDISHLAPDAGWERRAIQLPRSDMFRSSDSAYPKSIRSRQFRFPRQLGSSDTHDSPDPFPPAIFYSS